MKELNRIRILTAAALLLLIFTAVTAPLYAAAEGPDCGEWEAFLDEYINKSMQENNIPGVTVSVICGGRPVIVKGYGTSVVETGEPVSGETSRFRIGSVTKLFTFTAAMQLYEQGLLDLDAPAEDYIDFTLPNRYSRPIIVSDLMNHTAGFEETVYNLKARKPEDVQSIEYWVKNNIPGQVREPGSVSAYSNYGVTLLGYIIEQVSGMSYADYLRANILGPLGMDHTTVTAVEGADGTGLTGSYAVNGEKAVQVDAGYWHIAPAGSITSTAGDMAAFMLAHLGRSITPILKKETLDLMHSRSFSHLPQLNGMAHGFMENSCMGYSCLWHGGSTLYNISGLYLIPEAGAGIFISANSNTGSALVSGFCSASIKAVFPEKQQPAAGTYTGSDGLGRFTGTYHRNRSTYTTSEKALNFFGLTIISEKDGSLVIPGSGTFDRVSRLSFINTERNSLIRFMEDSRGRIIRCYINDAPIYALEKEALPENTLLHLFIIAAAVLFSVVTIIVQAARRRITGSLTFILRILITASAAALASTAIITGLDRLIFGETLLLRAAIWISPSIAAVSALALIERIRTGKPEKEDAAGAAVNIISIAAGIIYSALMLYWHLFVPVF